MPTQIAWPESDVVAAVVAFLHRHHDAAAVQEKRSVRSGVFTEFEDLDAGKRVVHDERPSGAVFVADNHHFGRERERGGDLEATGSQIPDADRL